MRVVGYRQQQKIAEAIKDAKVVEGDVGSKPRNFQANSIILSHHSYGQTRNFFFFSRTCLAGQSP